MTPTHERALSVAVAEEIKVWMLRRHITGQQLAARLDKSAAWVSYRLNGQVDIKLSELEAIADALGVEITDLLPARKPTHTSTPVSLSPHSLSHTAQPRPGHATATLTHQPTTTPITRPTHDHATAPRDRRPARMHTPHEDGRHQ